MAEKKKQNNLTNALLKCGVAAGPVYILVGLFEMMTRPGFTIFKHSLSLLSIGPLGWIHMSLFFVTGLLVILGAIGIRQAIRGEKAGTWAPILLGIYGLSLIAAGYFVPDPMRGFPPGALSGVISTSGIMHLFSGMIGFTGLIAACFVFARRFFATKQRNMAIFSIKTGIIFFVCFAGIASLSQQAEPVVMIVNLAFTFAVLLSWTWFSTVCSRLIQK